MKIRNDFVTNSSSSSFILCFENEESIFNELDLSNIPRPEQVIEDINNSERLSLDETLKYLEKAIKFNVRWEIEEEYNWSFLDIKEGAIHEKEFNKIFKERMSKKLEEFKKETSNKNIFIKLRYGSGGGGCDGDLEDAMSSCNCCYYTIDNH